ncbi:hypothetical protein QFZ35_001312 [Arthrobacter ulcerisalmonis]|nr:hypothetical protein [Arthrobacter ulcerisalmonis]
MSAPNTTGRSVGTLSAVSTLVPWFLPPAPVPASGTAVAGADDAVSSPPGALVVVASLPVAAGVGLSVVVPDEVAVTELVAVALSEVVEVGVAVVVAVSVEVAVAVPVAAGGVVDAGAQAGLVITFVSRETCPLRANARPSTLALVSTVMEVSARMVPLKLDAVPSVAELPTCQNTLQAWAPLMRMTLLAEAVTRVEATWKTNTELGLPWPSRVSCPLSAKELVDL